MNDKTIKIIFSAAVLILNGTLAAYNTKWIRDGISPLWTGYIFSFVSATAYIYMTRERLFSMTYTSAFQTFMFHAAWYITMLFVIGETLAMHRLLGLFFVFSGMILMSIK
ncbi:MAG: hypothetical protein FJW84_04080 [Actinobacteria bacterium]|nr:hypothetical protein [Actinomycetota bacterium]